MCLYIQRGLAEPLLSTSYHVRLKCSVRSEASWCSLRDSETEGPMRGPGRLLSWRTAFHAGTDLCFKLIMWKIALFLACLLEFIFNCQYVFHLNPVSPLKKDSDIVVPDPTCGDVCFKMKEENTKF